MRTLNAPARLALLFIACVHMAHAKINYAYVANNSANTVSVVQLSNNTVVKTIPVGSFPYQVAVNQADTFAYVTNSGSNTVSVISTSTNAVVATIAVQFGPMNIALSPNGKTAYVSNGNSISIINTGTKTVTTNIPVTNPIGLAVTPNGAFLYVVSSSAGNVLVISTLTKAIVATIPVGTNIPIALAISPDGSTAYVTNYNANTISVIRTADNTVANTINVSPGPFQEAISPDGRWLYVANYNAGGGNVVTAIDTSTQTVTSTIVVGTGPEQVSFSQDGSLAYVANFTTNNLSVINTASRTVVNTITAGKGATGVGVMGTMKVTTVAGGYVGDGGPATSAAFGSPYSSVFDNAGNLYISDFYMNRIRKVSTSGTITTYAGTGICGYNGDNIAAKKAMICIPNGLVFDAAGNLVFADGGNHRIRKISKTGQISTIAGNGVFGYAGDGGPALNASIGQPYKLAYDASGNLYFAQVGHCVVRKIDSSGIISTVAGNGNCGFSGDNGPAVSARLNFPRGVAFDNAGNLYISDTVNYRVRKVTPAGVITTFAGNGSPSSSGDGGPATSAAIGRPAGLIVRNGFLYISNAGRARVRTVDLATSVINTYAGSYQGYDGDNQPLLSTQFAGVQETLFDSVGNPVFDDAFNGRVRKASGGIVNTIAGGFLGDGNKATAAALVFPEALAVDKSGTLYIADWAGNRVRKVSAGTMTTVAGNGVSGYGGDGGPGPSAMLYHPLGVAVDSSGNVFIADSVNMVIRKVTPAGTISTFATDPNFCELVQMTVDSADNLYVADNCVNVIFKIAPSGAVSIVAGVLGSYGYNGDNIPATSAWLAGPVSVAVDLHGNIFIADTYNARVRQVTASGIISTIAGDGTCNYSGDGGAATSAQLCNANAIAVTASGTIYFSDFNYPGRIRKIAGGMISAFAGARTSFNGDGLWPLLTGFDDPVAIAVGSNGAVYVLDDWDHRVRKIQ